jgi:hypothetical protein
MNPPSPLSPATSEFHVSPINSLIQNASQKVSVCLALKYGTPIASDVVLMELAAGVGDPIGGPLNWSSAEEQHEDSQGDWDDSDGGRGVVGGDGSDVDMDEVYVGDGGSSLTSALAQTCTIYFRAGVLPNLSFMGATNLSL